MYASSMYSASLTPRHAIWHLALAKNMVIAGRANMSVNEEESRSSQYQSWIYSMHGRSGHNPDHLMINGLTDYLRLALGVWPRILCLAMWIQPEYWL